MPSKSRNKTISGLCCAAWSQFICLFEGLCRVVSESRDVQRNNYVGYLYKNDAIRDMNDLYQLLNT